MAKKSQVGAAREAAMVQSAMNDNHDNATFCSLIMNMKEAAKALIFGGYVPLSVNVGLST